MKLESQLKKAADALTNAVEIGPLWWDKRSRPITQGSEEHIKLMADPIVQAAKAYLALYVTAVESGVRSHTGLGWAIRRVASQLRFPVSVVEQFITYPPPKPPTVIIRVSVDPALKREAFIKAICSGVTKRAVIEAGLRAYIAGELNVTKTEGE